MEALAMSAPCLASVSLRLQSLALLMFELNETIRLLSCTYCSHLVNNAKKCSVPFEFPVDELMVAFLLITHSN